MTFYFILRLLSLLIIGLCTLINFKNPIYLLLNYLFILLITIILLYILQFEFFTYLFIRIIIGALAIFFLRTIRSYSLITEYVVNQNSNLLILYFFVISKFLIIINRFLISLLNSIYYTTSINRTNYLVNMITERANIANRLYDMYNIYFITILLRLFISLLGLSFIFIKK